MSRFPWFPWQRQLEFLRSVVPFDTLGEEKLREVVARLEIAFFPKGEVIIAKGGPPARYLYIIYKGSAKVSLPPEDGGEEILVDIRGEGDVFGAVSLLEGSKGLFQVSAREDMLCYLLPGEVFRELVELYPTFKRYFSRGLARNLEAVRQRRQPELRGLDVIGLGAALVRTKVRELMSSPVVTCLPATSVRTAARMMTTHQVGAIVVVEESGVPLGIMTDTDFRVRVMLSGRSFTQPVAEFISRPLITISPEAYGFEALLTMSRHGIHHLVVTDNRRVVGILSDRDLQAATGTSPVGVIREIERVGSVEELVRLHPKIDRVVEMLLRLGGSARQMLELVSEFNDRITFKLVELTLEEIETRGMGRAPVPFVWMALGSEGRREQTLRTDQDNALVFANVPEEDEPRIKEWFLAFAEQVVEGLVRCGFPRCKGGVMASNPMWCNTESHWARIFRQWVTNPNPKTLRLASIFFDFRGIYAEADYLDALQRTLKHALEDGRTFLRYLARNGLYNRPPLGFLRQFVVTKSGEHKDKLNLKLGGLTPIVDGARVLALEQGITTITNTIQRLEEVSRRGVIKPSMAADLIEAFEFITLLRIKHHLEVRARGEVPDNFVNPADLNSLQRKTLKESFRVISEFQNLLEHRFQTWLVT